VANGRTTDWLIRSFFDLNQGAVALWTGGLGIMGGMVGGVLGLWWYCRANQQPFLVWLDIAALCLPLGQAIGRIANGINQELYGTPTNVSWGMLVTREAQRVAPYTDLSQYPLATARFHPVFAYEALCCLTIFMILLLIWGWHKNLHPGTLTLLYMILYGIARFLLEFLRVNVSLVSGVNISQVVALFASIAATIWLLPRPRHLITDS
jgi:phosphatidylglycerol:prolipoprotein diacylglycerol transferase